ncbi:(2Fe-2S)-binding protein [Variovorax sp. UC122_21]|uniref:(2Fe-2S)-binding protein n=1 Tax=Variovorax sp. UC122_21 TaxID=3374554 RepID=UPI0037582AA7
MNEKSIRCQINGKTMERSVEVRRTLGDFLRHDCGMTGTHYGCEHGVCGACTVLLDGRTARSCLTLAVQVDGHEITTVEGLSAPDGTLSVLQQAFHECHALQCGFCTPGMLATLTELLADHADPSEAQIRDALTGNLCRCTGYQPIVEAAQLAARRLRATATPAHQEVN